MNRRRTKTSRRPTLQHLYWSELLETRRLLTAGPTVDGRANIFAAGSASIPGDASGLLPPGISIPFGTKYIEFSSVTGSISFDNVVPNTRPYYGPDGGPGITNIDSLGGISGIRSSRHGFLAGVFLTSTPPTSVTPFRMDVTGNTGFLSAAPSIQQTFFIGDGRTGTGVGYIQKFMVPQGATRLFVGMVDGYDEASGTISGPPRYYDDNAGSFSLNYTVHNDTPPMSVDGRANIFGAGLSTPPGEWPGILPISIPISPGATFVEFPSIAGAVTFDNQEPGTRLYYGPDGGTVGPNGASGLTDINSSGGISGIVHSSHGFLSGVFVSDAIPTGDPPTRLNFSSNSSFTVLSPGLRQSFLVGDGRTGNGIGSLQKFYVPAGATRLFLGFADGLNPLNNTIAGDRNYYHDNGGAFDVQHRVISSAIGTSGDDVFEISNKGVLLNGTKVNVSGNVVLEGGAGNDTYRFDADTSLGTYAIDESGGGMDSIDFTPTASAMRLALNNTGLQNVNQNLTLELLSATSLENLIGGSGNDLLTGNGLNNTISGRNGNDQITGLSGGDVMSGGPGHDTYLFDPVFASETDNVTEMPNEGTDTLSFSTLSTPVTLNLFSATLQNVHSLRTLILNSGTTFESAIGGSGADKLSGNFRNNTLKGSDGNDLLIGNGGSDQLWGGLGDDVYKFGSAITEEGDSVFEYANQGADTLDFSILTGGVIMDFGSTLSQAVSANRTMKLNSGSTIENIIGGSGPDSLTGNSQNNVLQGGRGSDTLTGKTGDDSYVFLAAISIETDTVIEAASAGRDSLDFSAVSDNITLSLATSALQTVHKNRRLQLNSAAGFENVFGGTGNDIFTGNSTSNILIGNSGNDRLSSGAGRDILVGGLGLDSVLGGDGDDILITGHTTYDKNIASLLSIGLQWNSSHFYAIRVANLMAGIGTSGVSLKAKNTVLNDRGEDDIGNGGTGSDWYFRALDDVITGLLSSESVGLL